VLTEKPEGVNHVLWEIHTGDAWKPECQRFCGDVPYNMPIALVVFANKSHLDLHSSISTLPIIFTLSFFNEKSRNSVDFWKPMAFLPNLNAGSLTSQNSNNKKKDPVISVQDEPDNDPPPCNKMHATTRATTAGATAASASAASASAASASVASALAVVL
jgi:hypothetical protein